MSAAGVRAAVEVIKDALYNVAIAVLNDDSVSTRTKAPFKNTLKDSNMRAELFAMDIATSNDIVLQALFNHYVVYLEWDRPPMYGKQPPIDALIDWAEKNDIPTDASTLWAISYAIWRDGHTGRPIFATIDKHLDKLFAETWAADLLEAIVDNLELYFND